VENAVYENGTPNTSYVEAYRLYHVSYEDKPEAYYVFDASYIKLRELTLSYSLPASVLGDSPIHGVEFSLVGRNLWIIKKNVKHFDPEYSIGSGNFQGIESGAYPTVRSMGIKVKVRL